MTNHPIATAVAEQEFQRFVEAMDFDVDPRGMDDEDRKSMGSGRSFGSEPHPKHATPRSIDAPNLSGLYRRADAHDMGRLMVENVPSSPSTNDEGDTTEDGCVEAADPKPRLFSRLAITLHTLLFAGLLMVGPLVGGLMTALNWRRLGNPRRALIFAAIGIVQPPLGLLGFLLLVSIDAPAYSLFVFFGAGLASCFVYRRSLRGVYDRFGGAPGGSLPFWYATFASIAFTFATAWLFGVAGRHIDLTSKTDDPLAALSSEEREALTEAGASLLQYLDEMTKGNDAVADNNYEQAVVRYRRATDAAPADFDARYNLALAYNLLGKHETAEKEAQEARELAKTSEQESTARSLGHFARGNAAVESEAWSIAAEHYEEALRFDPHSTGSRFNLAICYEHLGKIDDAVEQLRRILEAHPSDEEAQQFLDQLKGASSDEQGPSNDD